MTITQEQRTYARLAGIMFLANYVLQGLGDSVTIIARNGETFAQTARFAAENMVLWRFCLLNVGPGCSPVNWIALDQPTSMRRPYASSPAGATLEPEARQIQERFVIVNTA